jgi:RraA family protein
MDFDEIKERLSDLYVASICDADKNVRAMDGGIRPLQEGVIMIGRARTVSCKDDFLTVIKALAEAEEDDILVIDGQGGTRALAGGLFSMEAERKDLGGIIVDGAVRDTDTIQSLDIPVFARHIFPVSGTANQIGQMQITVTVGGVTVAPGDIIFGDDDGIIVASTDELSQLIPIAEEIQKNEARVESRMKKGDSLVDMLNFSEHFQKVQDKQESKLAFNL